MRQEFKRIPDPLQRQIFVRLGLGALFLILLIAVATTALDIYLWLPCAGMAIFFTMSAFALFRRAVLDDYVIVTGKCASVEFTAVRKRAKSLLLRTDECSLQVALRGRMRKIPAGVKVRLYIAKNTPVYEHNGNQMLYTYLAMEIL